MTLKKTIKKGGTNVGNIFIQEDIFITASTKLYDEIIKILNKEHEHNIEKMKKFLAILSSPSNYIFDDIADVVRTYYLDKKNFQSKIRDNKDLFSFHELWNKEDTRKFITIDPTIIQIMIFDDEDMSNDIVYSLKIIIRNQGKITLRYTTQLFPQNSKIDDNFEDLSNFNKFNKSLGNEYIDNNYNKELIHFLKIYIKFYNFYKKCYTIKDICDDKKSNKRLIDYQLKYISILGKARFGYTEVQKRTSLLTDYIMSNLIFTSPTYAFISGGYKGFKTSKYGITRSGYEIAKKYNRPILTIMCKEGMHDAHEYSDAELIYGEHWGEDSIALSQLTDGAIVIAPFGGWTYIECLTLLANKKIVVIYNDLFNILNYEGEQLINSIELEKLIKKEREIHHNLTDNELKELIKKKAVNKTENKNFFMFTLTEQNNIIDYYINFYLILLNITKEIIKIDQVSLCLEYGIKILMVLKSLLPGKTHDSDIPDFFISLINVFNEIKTNIKYYINYNLIDINNAYKKFSTDEYQNKIPEKCDGIWIKPAFNLIDCIEKTGGNCKINNKKILDNINNYKINMDILKENPIFKNLNNNIIFVFSDIMYLTTYLNLNLNTSSYQEKIHTKINKLSSFTIPGSRSSLDILSQENTRKYIELNRNIDGMFNTEQGKIINENIIREKYSFMLNESCNNYSSIVEEIVTPPIYKGIRKTMTLTDALKRVKTLKDIKTHGSTLKDSLRRGNTLKDMKIIGNTLTDMRRLRNKLQPIGEDMNERIKNLEKIEKEMEKQRKRNLLRRGKSSEIIEMKSPRQRGKSVRSVKNAWEEEIKTPQRQRRRSVRSPKITLIESVEELEKSS
jgi:hypothetical protein